MRTLDTWIAGKLGSSVTASLPASGGCIHDTRSLDLADGRRVFVKSARGAMAASLAAEARGLELLSPHIHTPTPLGNGESPDGSHWLALEWLELLPPSPRSWADLGQQLARLHAVTFSTFGLDHDNFIGATPQSNQASDNWSEFFREQRLRPQIQIARQHGHDLPETRIFQLSDRALADHHPSPALLHGDLWSGNTAALPDGSAVVFDPAPYFGDPETDLAMLELFGGPLPEPFLSRYTATSPERFRRQPLYDLYHALNHLNLFGSDYAPMVRRYIEKLDFK